MLSEAERKQVDAANGSGKPVVVFIHGLWLLAGSWDAWRAEFESVGYSTVAADWPDDPPTVAEAKQHPEFFAGKSIAQVADHLDEVVRAVTRKPAIVGHSFGGLMTQILAGRGLSAVSVAIDPAPFRGVLPLPLSALRSAMPVLVNPLNRGRAVTLDEKQFRYGWGNALSDDESRKMHDTFHVAGAGKPIFQAALANINPWTEAKVNTKHPERGPLLIIDGEMDHTVPWSLANAAYKRQSKSSAATEIKKVAGRGHSLTIDSGWQEVCRIALDFVRRFSPVTA
jgi:pimeloyl-ACP methyl ester carboxylesterase